MRKNPSARLEDMLPRDTPDSDGDTIGPYDNETSLRILDVQDRRPIGLEIQCITEPSLHIVRSRISEGVSVSVGDSIEIPSEDIGHLSEVRLKDLTGSSQQELVGALSASIILNPETHLNYYNSAGPMSLKFHSFQLLPGIGNSKAIQMVQLRGMAGWETFEQIDKDCGIESVTLLAERYVKEMEDVAQTPRLLDLLVRSEK